MQAATPVIYSLAEAPLHILLHLAVALLALLLGAFVLFRRKGTQSHKLLGRLWAVLMLIAAVSSFFIQARGRFSLIHVLSVVILVVIPYGVYLARSRQMHKHRKTMIAAYLSLCIAGIFTLLPYRMLGQLVFR